MNSIIKPLAAAATLVVADGTSCRHQIDDGASRAAVHVAVVIARALDQKSRSV